MRLDRWLTTLGMGSRSEVQRLIRSGAVAVAGETVRDPGMDCATEVTPLRVRGESVDGRTVRHVMLHKPEGLLTAAPGSEAADGYGHASHGLCRHGLYARGTAG